MSRLKTRPWRRPADRASGLDRFEAAILAAFVLYSMWVLGVDLWQVLAHGRTWTGTDGVYLADQLQYLAWIRSASHEFLISNLYVLRATPADYFQPAMAVSGGLAALGMAPWLALLLWKPVAVLGAFYAVRSYVRASLEPTWQRRAAVLVALFFASFTVLYGSAGVIGDLMPGFLSWGYLFALLAIALMAAALVAYAREREGARDPRGPAARTALPGLLGGLACLLHPWHGELLIATLLLGELWLALARRRRPLPRELRAFAATLLGTAVPLVYYAVLGWTDQSWRLARVASKHSFPLWWALLALAPLLLAAIPAYRVRPREFLAAATRAWPVAALAVYVVSGTVLGATPLHAFEGITIPLAVLAVEGVNRFRLPTRQRLRTAVAVMALAAFTLPADLYQLANARSLVAPREGTARFITGEERRALHYLAADADGGGVISRSYLGALVPGATGRHTYVGNCLWSEPGCASRLVTVRELFAGRLRPAAARSFVAGSGARFLLADCRSAPDLRPLLGRLVGSVLRFGCARIYVLRTRA